MTRNPLPDNPFVGLRPFQSYESPLFFGRNEQSFALLQKLYETRFVAVLGSSGSGKSSLIRAGLIPKLKAGFLVDDRDQWQIVIVQPGDSPLKNLAAQLLAASGEPAQDEALDEFLDHLEVYGARAALEKLAPLLVHSNTNLFLLIDQFEEIFRFDVTARDHKRHDEAADFVEIMLDLAAQRDLPIYLVMTMRSDFLGDCDTFHGLPEALNRSQYLVPRLTRQQRREVVEGPIRFYGETIRPRLLDRVLNDVTDEHDQLPILQHAMMRTWQQWQSDRNKALDLADYEAIGTIEYALSQHADQALEGMDETTKTLTCKLFQALTITDENNRQIRHPASIAELREITGADAETILNIVQRFRSDGRSFLFVHRDPQQPDDNDRAVIDITHECLIRKWRVLQHWVEQEAQLAELFRELIARSHEGEPLSARQVAKYQEWFDSDPSPVWAQRYQNHDTDFEQAIQFLLVSEAELERQEEQAQQEQQRQLHEAQRRFRIMTIMTIVMAILALIAGVSIYYDWQLQKYQIAEQAEDIKRDQQQTAKVLRFQSLWLAEMSRRQSAANNIVDGILLALEALPKNLAKPERPYLSEAIAALDEAVQKHQQDQNTAGSEDNPEALRDTPEHLIEYARQIVGSQQLTPAQRKQFLLETE